MRVAALVIFFCAFAAGAQQIALQRVIEGLQQPVAITHAGDRRLFITLQRGEIVIWDGYVFGDYCIGNIWGITPLTTGWNLRQLLSAKIRISTFGEDVDGELYAADYAAGVIYRIVDQSPPLPKRRAVGH